MVFTKPICPKRIVFGEGLTKPIPQGQLDGMTLTIIKADGLDAFKTVQGPCEAGGGILSS